MQTIHCRERLGEQECQRETAPDRERPVTMQDGTSGRHYECTKGHRFHVGTDGKPAGCDCGSLPADETA